MTRCGTSTKAVAPQDRRVVPDVDIDGRFLVAALQTRSPGRRLRAEPVAGITMIRLDRCVCPATAANQAQQ